MAPRGGRQRPAAFYGRGLALGLALALLAPDAAPAAPAVASARAPKVPTLYHKRRSFRIPFNIDPQDRPRLKEVQLWVSRDSGFRWKPESVTTPDRPAFTFRAARDGEYWFAVRTLDPSGQLYPSVDEKVEPSMKVVVDTSPPSVVLEPEGRRGSLAAVRWEVRDEHLDLKTLVLEYQADGARDWRSLPVAAPSLIGRQNWDAGTAEPLKVRATVADRAGNVTEAVVNLPEGTAQNPGAAAGEAGEFAAAPPVSQISSGPVIPPADEPPGPGATPEAFGFGSSEPTAAPAPASPPATVPAAEDFSGSAPAPTPSPAPAPAPAPAPEGAARPGQPLLVPGPRFPLQYEVDDAGPDGPAAVELWVTQDGGQTWFRKGTDPDRVSPFPVDLGGEGTFGLRLVARAASGLGDPPPAMGDAPDLTVQVDSTAPAVQMLPPVAGTRANLGKVAVRWKATDAHLGPKPVTISWRPEPSGTPWQPVGPPVENTGQFIWTVPANVPPRFHLRVDVVDSAGNRGYAETTEGAPVVVDRTRPRGRIIGLDRSAAGAAAGARPRR